MSQPIPISRTVESSTSWLAGAGVPAGGPGRKASTDGPAPETTAGTPAARSLATSWAVSGITWAR